MNRSEMGYAVCHECEPDQLVRLDVLIDHLTEHGVHIETWPDGRPVVVDTTLDPDEFMDVSGDETK